MSFFSRLPRLAVWLLLSVPGCKNAPEPVVNPPVMPPTATTFTNPLLSTGPDPWVIQKDGFYYYMHTTGINLTLWKTAKMSELGSAVSKVIWTPPASGLNTRAIWAPEIHFLDGKWYVYFTAGNCCGAQRLWVLENPNADPTTGSWTEKGQLAVPGQDLWAIDATILEQNGNRYLVWSGQEPGSEQQNLYIASMSNPWTITGPRVRLSQPTERWEINGFPSYPKVNEGPEILKHGGKTFIVFSASHCSSDDYALGLLTASSTADPMDPAAWTKTPTPIFTKNPTNHAYGPGHNAFFTSKDGREDWIIYHANLAPNQGCGNARNPRMQKFEWNADGTPNFDTPVTTGTPLPRPGGE
ncbi:glycoside hydrolase family 43 protein [Hymenobacter sp. BT664]|uniref:Glycoside hydrolase family 43 protein n=1 Tax=Hymenobacter montanus TaxID=2771359 RepID=A0A927B9E2_9BACT|nr:glycoside hydrolase family 43 protein [Hymenobacter montanus]MBD2766291.1 glycoside hydrolase family 43 protein [Hymenobacter montanus]